MFIYLGITEVHIAANGKQRYNIGAKLNRYND